MMGTPFKIPKKKQPSDSSVIRMTSPLSRLQDDVTIPSHWNRDAFNRHNSNPNGGVHGRREAKSGSPKIDQWRPKRASDKLCQREDVKHTPAAKKQWGPGLSMECRTLQPEDDDDDDDEEEHQKETSSPVTKTQSVNPHACVEAGVAVKQNGRSTHSSPYTHAEDRTPAKLARTQKDPPVQKAGGGCVYTCRKLRPSLKTYQRIKPSSAEPIVLSSGDEDEEDDETHSAARPKSDLQKGQRPKIQSSSPAMMELAFATLFFGTTQSHASGPIVITEESIRIPLKGPNADDGTGEYVSVSVVPSELRAYGVWDATGSGLTALNDSSSSLLFFALSDAQAVLLNTELLPLHKHTTAPPSPFVLVHLVGRLDGLQRATLASLMDVMAVRSGHTSLGTPLSQEEGLSHVTSHQHGARFLNLLGNKESRNGTRSVKAPAVTTIRHALRSHGAQPSMPKRLIQYPPPPSKGAITVTTEDLECLRDGEFLNDVIIDFYLKYLHLERADRDVAQRSHIFSSFFYKQLTRKANSSEEEAGGTAAYRRHGRVRTWTRNVDIFSKDFLFIPVNQESHWYLVVICFPGLLQLECVPWKKSQTGSSVDSKADSKGSTLKASDLPDCAALTCQRNMITRRPCILIMDSLKLSYHNRVYMLLQEYLQVEWEVRRGTPRVFNNDSIKGSNCKVPLQDNSSDCGLYLLQYVESFLQNPIVHFDLPLRLERWFPRQQVRRKRAELRELVLHLYQEQVGGAVQSS